MESACFSKFVFGVFRCPEAICCGQRAMRQCLLRSARSLCGAQAAAGNVAGCAAFAFAAGGGVSEGGLGLLQRRRPHVSFLRTVAGWDGVGISWRRELARPCSELQQVRGLSWKKPKAEKPVGKKIGAPRGPLWRTRKSVSKEVVQAVQELKRAHVRREEAELAQVYKTRVSRLLKIDLIGVLHELQRQNEIELTVRTFQHMRKEAWYKPDAFLYRDLLDCLARNKAVAKLEEVWSILESETTAELVNWTELVGGYLRNGMFDKAVEAFEKMKASGIEPDHFTYSILIKALWKAEQFEVASKYRDERMKAFPEMDASLRIPA